MQDSTRKIPYNYTSADDDQVITHLFDSDFLEKLQFLDPKKDTGRSSRLLSRFMGDLFIIQRNPFLWQELVFKPRLRTYLFSQFKNDLDNIKKNADHKELSDILKACHDKYTQLIKSIEKYQRQTHTLIKKLVPIIGKRNISVDAFDRCAHATDATDWRLYLPVAVLRPDKESQVTSVIKKIKELGYHIIPRGGGTGLTGGATPLHPKCVILNTEKLNTISEIEFCKDSTGRQYASLHMGTGVITQEAIDFADSKGFIFATDPTSAWGSTIGGNLSENAGGKKAVLFGTAIDNVLSYNIAMPNGENYCITRTNHPLRKTKPGDVLEFDIKDSKGSTVQSISIHSGSLRKKGLGKDVTNKALNGLFGLQKEGCDGIITSARFILYPKFAHTKTVCIEFFGSNMSQAAEVITLITRDFSDQQPALAALEHFDEEYVKAIQYKTKTMVGSRLIAVLLVDIVSNSQKLIQLGITKLKLLLEPFDKTDFVIAEDDAQAKRFWQDRKRLGAIAAHTNAFKLNEDIVLPIDALANFASWVDQQNIYQRKLNQIDIIQNIVAYLDKAVPLADPELLKKSVGQAKDLAYHTKKKLDIASRDAIEGYIHAKNFYKEVLGSIRGYTLVTENINRIFTETRARRIVIATHMHAGDGNVHVNIPVMSNDREMMKRANEAAECVMAKALELNGAVSGEHGIGVTKVKFLDSQKLDEFKAYKDQVDPDRMMNPEKLEDPTIIDKMFTPSFHLLDIEARILKHTSLSDLANKIANCVRCGKCKVSCPVFYPKENLFFHPRNKNIALGALIEGLLYITQRTQSTGFGILKYLEQMADHCTVCHKCQAKCPVDIDSGNNAILERNLLVEKKFKHSSLPTNLTLSYLGTQSRAGNSLIRTALIKGGASVQRFCARISKPFHHGKMMNRSTWAQLIQSPVAKPHTVTLRKYLPHTEKNQAIVIEPEGTPLNTVFYFPGCGSERIFSTISMAGIFLLLKNQVRVVLPPAYMCCSYPFMVNAKKAVFEKMMLENSIVFARIRSMFQDLDFDAVLVSCGTCMDSLSRLDIARTFNCGILDAAQFVLENDSEIRLDMDCLYHAPCHDSMSGNAAALLGARMNGHAIKKMPHCCSEAGTMALSRPDISSAMLKRKQEALSQVGNESTLPVLTNCPSCLQGLGRLRGNNHIYHILEVLAQIRGGDDWKKQFLSLARQSEVVNF